MEKILIGVIFKKNLSTLEVALYMDLGNLPIKNHFSKNLDLIKRDSNIRSSIGILTLIEKLYTFPFSKMIKSGEKIDIVLPSIYKKFLNQINDEQKKNDKKFIKEHISDQDLLDIFLEISSIIHHETKHYNCKISFILEATLKFILTNDEYEVFVQRQVVFEKKTPFYFTSVFEKKFRVFNPQVIHFFFNEFQRFKFFFQGRCRQKKLIIEKRILYLKMVHSDDDEGRKIPKSLNEKASKQHLLSRQSLAMSNFFIDELITNYEENVFECRESECTNEDADDVDEGGEGDDGGDDEKDYDESNDAADDDEIDVSDKKTDDDV